MSDILCLLHLLLMFAFAVCDVETSNFQYFLTFHRQNNQKIIQLIKRWNPIKIIIAVIIIRFMVVLLKKKWENIDKKANDHFYKCWKPVFCHSAHHRHSSAKQEVNSFVPISFPSMLCVRRGKRVVSQLLEAETRRVSMTKKHWFLRTTRDTRVRGLHDSWIRVVASYHLITSPSRTGRHTAQRRMLLVLRFHFS